MAAPYAYNYGQSPADYNASMSTVGLTAPHSPYTPQPGPYSSGPRYAPPPGTPLGAYDPPPARQRTPSPTPSEMAEINAPLYDYSHLKRKEWWLQWRLVPWYILGLLLVVGATLITVYHKQIVKWLRPAADWMHDLKFGYLIPVAIFFVISFPPLFGHEIVAVICGMVWGLGIGFAITCAGTFLGEVGNFYAFKYCCRGRAEKLEHEKPYYECLARVVREGGFKVALMARLSAVPGHFTTAVFATCGMGIWTFCLAALLSLPKQFITVYAGVMLEQSESGDQGEDKTQKIISDVVAGLSVVITFYALWWIYRAMVRVKPEVFRERRRRRLAKLADDSTTRVGTVRMDKYGSAVDDEYELRGRPDVVRFAQNRQRDVADGDAESVESTASDAPVLRVDYNGRREQFAAVDGDAARRGYASPSQQYSGVYAQSYDGRSGAAARRPSIPQQQYYPPIPPPPGAGYARPTPTQQSYPRPPDQYRLPPPQSMQPERPPNFSSPPQSPPPTRPSQFASPPRSPPPGFVPAPQASPFSDPVPPSIPSPVAATPSPPRDTAPASATRYALSDGPVRQPSHHSREATDAGQLTVPRGGRHVSEATAYYSASEGEEDDVPEMPPPPSQSRMPGTLFREESEPGPGWH